MTLKEFPNQTTTLITGGSGTLGKEIRKTIDAKRLESLTIGSVNMPSHRDMPIESFGHVRKEIQKWFPSCVLHLAAMTNIEECEKNKKRAWEINVLGTYNLLKACEKYVPQCYFVYISTPCVFEGGMINECKPIERFENDFPNPNTYYGFTKAIAESMVRMYSGAWCIIRVNFRPKEKYKSPKAFTDRFSNFLFADETAKAINEIMDDGKTGVVHVAGDRMMSMLEFARMCPNSENVEPLTLEEFYDKNPNFRKLPKYVMLGSREWKKYTARGRG